MKAEIAALTSLQPTVTQSYRKHPCGFANNNNTPLPSFKIEVDFTITEFVYLDMNCATLMNNVNMYKTSKGTN